MVVGHHGGCGTITESSDDNETAHISTWRSYFRRLIMHFLTTIFDQQGHILFHFTLLGSPTLTLKNICGRCSQEERQRYAQYIRIEKTNVFSSKLVIQCLKC